MKKFNIPKETFIGGWFMEDRVIDGMNKFVEENKDVFKPTIANPMSKTCKEIGINPRINVYGELRNYNFALNEVIRCYVADFMAWQYTFDWRINEIYNMTMTQRQGFKKKYPTSESLANAIQEVFKSSILAEVRKDLEKTKLQDVKITGGFKK